MKNSAYRGARVVLFFFFFLTLIYSAPASAQTTSGTASNTAEMEALQKQIQLLLGEIQGLKTQVTAMQSELRGTSSVSTGKPSVPPADTSIGSRNTPAEFPETVAEEEVVEEETEIPPPELTRSLFRGSRGEDVRSLQEFLAQDTGIYPEGLITGYYGVGTERAVRRWQSKNDVSAVGRIGPQTIAKFREMRRAMADQFTEDEWSEELVFPDEDFPVVTPRVTRQNTCPVFGYLPVCRSGQSPENRNGCTVCQVKQEESKVKKEIKIEPPPIKTEICPALPTVESCPAGQEKTVSYQSDQCGTYYTCTLKKETEQQILRSYLFPHTLSNGKTLNSLLEIRTYCLANGPGSGQAISAECTDKFGVVYGTQTIITHAPSAGQKEQTWNSLGLRSWIRTDADQNRIGQLKQACVNTPLNSNVWTPNAGVSTSVDFGFPDASKCRLAAGCSSGQYFDGASCVTGAQTATQTSTQTTTANTSTQMTTTSTSSCSNALTALLGIGCHYMYPGGTDGKPIYCDSPMSKSAKEGDAATTSGCSSPYGGTVSTGSCSALGVDWTLSGNYCLNYSRSQYVPLSSLTMSSVQSCTGPNTPISGCAIPGGGSTYSTSCPSGNYWNGSSCVVTTYTYSSDPATACSQAGGSWNSSTSYCQMPGGSTSSTSCPSGNYWNGSACVPPSITSTTCPSGNYWSGTACVISTTPSSCSSGQYWNGSSCVTSTTSSSCSSPGNCYDSAVCASSGWSWYNGGCWSSPQSTGGGTSSSCPSGNYWNGSSCVVTTYTYSSDPATACSQAGGSWNSSTSYCQMPTTGGSSTTCPSGNYWSGTACVPSTAPTCPSGNYWNGTACVTSPTSFNLNSTRSLAQVQATLKSWENLLLDLLR